MPSRPVARTTTCLRRFSYPTTVVPLDALAMADNPCGTLTLPNCFRSSIFRKHAASETAPKSLIFPGERAGTRTQDILIKSQALYRLSYALPPWERHG